MSLKPLAGNGEPHHGRSVEFSTTLSLQDEQAGEQEECRSIRARFGEGVSGEAMRIVSVPFAVEHSSHRYHKTTKR